LSTTFLSVIVARTLFYKKREVYLIWIFPDFSLDTHLQKFTQKDVYYNNSFNVYVFDKEARERSNSSNQLILKCFYKKFTIKNEKLNEEWESAFIKINELTSATDKSEVYFYDSVENKKSLEVVLSRQKTEQIEKGLKASALHKVENSLQYLREYYKHNFD